VMLAGPRTRTAAAAFHAARIASWVASVGAAAADAAYDKAMTSSAVNA